MIRYGIKCTTNIPNGAPVWKKVVQVIWLDQYDEICLTRDDSKSHPPPPQLPKLTESSDDLLESNLMAELMAKLNEQLRR